MAHIVVLGGGIGGVSCAYELKDAVRKEDRITLVSNKPFFQFTPSNPWVGGRTGARSSDIIVDLAPVMPKHGIEFIAAGAERVHPAENRVELGDGTSLDYDYLVIATGPELAFDEIEGLRARAQHESVCDVDHADTGQRRLGGILQGPRPDRGRRRAGRVVLRPGLRIRDDHGYRPAQAARSATRCR